MPCNTSELVIDILQEKYNEEPVGLGMGSIYGPDGKPRPGQLVIWKNNTTKTFTVTFTPQDTDLMCFISSGKDLTFLIGALGDSI
jgi:hypothetical protein